MPNKILYGSTTYCNFYAHVKYSPLVRINRVFNALDIHMPDPEPLMRSPAKGREQGGRGKPGLRIQR